MEKDQEKIKILRSLLIPLVFIIILWMVRGVDEVFDLDLNRFGLQPLRASGLAGIITAPVLHADAAHLFANSVPLLILGALMFYFYREIAWKTVLLIWLITGAWVWVFARGTGIHVGASGVVYGIAAFLFFSGIIRQEKGLMVITLLVTFLYGGMIWGVFPELFPNQPISWESHLMGLLSGTILSFYFRKQGPQKKEWDWGDEEEEDTGHEENLPPEGQAPADPQKPFTHSTASSEVQIRYHSPEQ